jgi:phage gpG-like protein
MAFTPDAGIPNITLVFDGCWADINKATVLGLEKLATLMPGQIQKTFDAAGERGGNPPWHVGWNPTPLIDTGHLYRSFVGDVDITDDDQYELSVSTDVEYARKHDEGLEGMWQRPFMFFADEDMELALDILGGVPI